MFYKLIASEVNNGKSLNESANNLLTREEPLIMTA